MKHKVFLGIGIRIIILCIIGMLFTFVPDHLRDFFGDIKSYKSNGFGIDEEWDWGARHYWYWWMMFLLFMLSLVNAIISIVSIIQKHYEDVF